ncbi:MAG: type II toxin-antitoxin system RelE/ParE family toxin [Flavobacteriales bacterium]|nr:type II toxin-antitoxin system RelE/ParE family toxin [Flavobacteriales bacterium]
MSEIYLTHRALSDIQEIYDYSVHEFSEIIADKYLNGFENALNLIKTNLDLLKIKLIISNRFKVYNVQKHWFIFDNIDDKIFLLTVKHISMNLLERLQQLEPSLEAEAEILYKQLK